MIDLTTFIDDRDLDALIGLAREEDLGPRSLDVTTEVTVDGDRACTGLIASREPGILCGCALLPRIAAVYGGVGVESLVRDGDAVEPEATVARLSGRLRDLLAMERVALNFMCHLSGIATLTAAYVRLTAGTRARIYDTRKTLPGLRGLQKYAVAAGGGGTHRMGLYDAVMIKDNHIAGHPAGRLGDRIRASISEARRHHRDLKFIEVEVDSLEQFEALIDCGADILLLDNMPPAMLRRAVETRDRASPGVELEASGGVSLDTVRSIAETGVDRISVGALTHSAPALDLGLDLAVSSGPATEPRDRLLDALLESRGRAVAAERLTRDSGVAPAALRGLIDGLRRGGCDLDETPAGIRLLRSGLGVWAEYLEHVLRDGPARRVEVYPSTRSTQELIKARAPEPLLVLADFQTAGRGRLGRSWIAPAGSGVLMSLTHRAPADGSASIDNMSFRTAVAVAATVERIAGAACVQIRWPNDIMVDGRKLAGILVERVTASTSVIGVGLNVDLDPKHAAGMDEDLRRGITSFRACGWPADRLLIAARLVEAIDRHLATPDGRGLIEGWRRRNLLREQTVRLRSDGETIVGTVIDLDPDDGLIVRRRSGEIVHLRAATTSVI